MLVVAATFVRYIRSTDSEGVTVARTNLGRQIKPGLHDTARSGSAIFVQDFGAIEGLINRGNEFRGSEFFD